MATTERGTVYLLHFAAPYKHARHYVGFTTDLERRLKEHGTGAAVRSANLMAAVHHAGIPWTLARTWPGTRALEWYVKQQRATPKLCPFCSGGRALDGTRMLSSFRAGRKPAPHVSGSKRRTSGPAMDPATDPTTDPAGVTGDDALVLVPVSDDELALTLWDDGDELPW